MYLEEDVMGFERKINVKGYGNGYVKGDVVMHDHEERENGLVFSPSSSSPKKCIEHRVTKMDTLAGIAIRYGVEVADIKKMNNLVTDIQMFALKTLRIPLPGRHSPSPCLSDSQRSEGSSQTASPRRHFDLLESFQSLKLTPDHNLSHICSLRDCYNLDGRRNGFEGYEEGEGFSTSSSLMKPPPSQHQRSSSVASSFGLNKDKLANGVDTYHNKWINRHSMRSQKTEDTRTPEKLLKVENGSGSWFSAISEKGLALRTKAPSRTNLVSEEEAITENVFLFSLGESIMDENSSGVGKSFTSSSFQDQNGNCSVSIWSVSNWSLTPDLKAAFANTIFEGLPKPITGRSGKAALD